MFTLRATAANALKFSTLINPFKPLSSLHRHNSGNGVDQEETKEMREAKKFFEEFKLEHAARYPTDKNPLYDYLRQRSEIGFTPAQMDLFRKEFFFRTKGTAISVALAIASSLKAHDWISAAKISQNMFEEAGNGDPKNLHLVLLEKCFNDHLKHVFGLYPLKMRDVTEDAVLGVTKEFRDLQSSVMAVAPYPKVAGRLWAHEREADDMLCTFRSAFFEPYKDLYEQEDYVKMVEYFAAHIESGVEARHEEDAAIAAVRAIAAFYLKKGSKQFAKGAEEFSASQAGMWAEWLVQMKEREFVGKAVSPTKIVEVSSNKPNGILKVGPFDATHLDNNNNQQLVRRY